jgi:MFS superfamily sulfate permease-like transporter
MKPIKRFFSHNYEAIKMGVLVGLLVSNIFLIFKQADTLSEVLSVSETIQGQIKEDNENRVQSRKESEQRNNLIIKYLRCIALIPYGQRTPETVDRCLSSQVVESSDRNNTQSPVSQMALPSAIVSDVSPSTSQTNQPTTSSPPPKEITPSQPQPIQQDLIQGTLNNINTTVNGLLNGLLR